VLKEIFDSFLGEKYEPPIDNPLLLFFHLWALHLFYSEIIFHLENVSIESLFKIDFALTKICSYAMGYIQMVSTKIPRERDRTKATKDSKNKKWAKIDQTIIELYYSIDQKIRAETKIYPLANKILKKWPEEEKPSDRYIVDKLRSENLKN
jgi:hypothetical protein